MHRTLPTTAPKRKTTNTKKAFLKEALAKLKPGHQDVVTLRFYEGLNSEQIGEILEMKPATVRSQLARALKKIKDLYKNRQQQTSEELCWYE